MDNYTHLNVPREYSFLRHRESIESSQSLPSTPRYKSRFTEHVSQAYTAPPPSDWPLRNSKPGVSPASPRSLNNHKHTRSVESFGSASSTSSTSSFRRLKEFISGTSAKFRPRAWSDGSPREEFVIKGSNRRFTRDDIKYGGLTGSSNLLHQI